uniref:Uncharacterized protein n=1 Tax=Anguilla anguilla TaxID=7936 RepID=A0A0E9RTU3_ANGAN
MHCPHPWVNFRCGWRLLACRILNAVYP